MQAAFVDRPGAVGDPASAFQQRPDGGMGLEPLHFIERRQVGVLVIECDDEPDGDLAPFLMIDETAAGRIGQRPAQAVDDGAVFVLLRIAVP